MTQADSVYIIAKYDYKAQSEEELSLKKNERLILLDDSDGRSGWWKAINDANRAGFIPSNYVRKERLIDTLRRKLTPRSSSLTTSDTPQPSSESVVSPSMPKAPLDGINQRSILHADSKPTAVATVTYTYTASQPDEISLTKGDSVVVLEKSDDGWWQGRLVNGSVGWFPSNYVSDTVVSPQPCVISRVNDWQEENLKSTSTSNPIEEVDEGEYLPVFAIYSFDAETPEELSITKGENLQALQNSADDQEWIFARNQSGETGLVPSVYIRPVVDKKVIAMPQHNGKANRLPPPRPPMPSLVQKSTGSDQTPAIVDPIKPSSSFLTPATAKRKCSGIFASCPWYFGRITRDESDFLLTNFGCEGDFLIRDSESNVGDFSVSMKARDRNKHFWVRVQNDGTYGIGTRRFGDLEELISHYKNSPIYSNDRGEKLYLKTPLSSLQQ